MEIDSEVPMALQLDGEEFGRTPARITVRPRALRVVRSG
jgi:diacylglycerol kinase family enzyme